MQLTDSPYVVVNMRIMARIGLPVLREIDRNNKRVVPCMHSVGAPLAPGQADVPWPCNQRSTSSTFPRRARSGPTAPATAATRCWARSVSRLRIASNIARDEGWMAEHMLILGVEDPQGEKTYVAAAFPSACGKTNFAMLIPPDGMKGWKVWTVGDDIAWIKPDANGRLRAINPEAGFFGVAPGTSRTTNPNAMATVARNTIFTNVALTPEGGVWWEGMTDEPPAECLDWQGERWTPEIGEETGAKAAHPNARFTAPASQCPTIDPDWEEPEGVPISAIIFGGRRADHDAAGLSGVQLELGRLHRRDDGLGDDRRGRRQRRQSASRSDGDAAVLRLPHGRLLPPLDQDAAAAQRDAADFSRELVPQRRGGQVPVAGLWREHARAEVDRRSRARPRAGKETPIGWMPRYEDIEWRGLDFPKEQFEEMQRVDRAAWRREVIGHEELFIDLHDHLPPEMVYERELLICRL